MISWCPPASGDPADFSGTSVGWEPVPAGASEGEQRPPEAHAVIAAEAAGGSRGWLRTEASGGKSPGSVPDKSQQPWGELYLGSSLCT